MVLLASCSDSNIDGEWDLDEPEPPVVIDSSLCTEMPGRDFEEPQIVQESEDTWRIRYPLFENECGVYQLDTIFNLAADDRERRIYSYEMNVCNRCESAQWWSYLSELGHTELGQEDIEMEIPQEPLMRETSGLYPTAMPIVEHWDASEAQSFRVCGGLMFGSYWGNLPSSFVSYSQIDYMPIERGQRISEAPYTMGLEAFKRFATNLLAWQPVEKSFDRTTIYWPILSPKDTRITGSMAASGIEFCTPLSANHFIRPYPGEYDPTQKYKRQEVPTAVLPPTLVAKLQEAVNTEVTH